MKKTVLLLCCILLYSSCKKEPVAAFEVYGTTKAGVPVAFFNNSTNSDKYFWDLGDGTSSAAEAPSHIFQKAALYNVTLYAVGESGYASVTKEIKITGTTFSFINNTPIDIPGFFTFYPNGTEVEDYLLHGLLMKNKETNILSTTKSKVLFGFGSEDFKYFGVETYELTSDKHRTIILDNSTQIYGGKNNRVTIGDVIDQFVKQQK